MESHPEKSVIIFAHRLASHYPSVASWLHVKEREFQSPGDSFARPGGPSDRRLSRLIDRLLLDHGLHIGAFGFHFDDFGNLRLMQCQCEECRE